MKPTRQDVLLSIIAIALCAIAIKMIFYGPTTYGDFRSLAKIQDVEVKKKRFASLIERIPIVWVRGGSVDVSGSVEIDR